MFNTHRPRRTALVVLVGLLVLFGAAAQTAAARSEAPFRAGLVVLNEPPATCAPAQLCLALTGGGLVTHLGRVSIVGQAVIHLTSQPGPTPDCRNVSTEMLLTAANSDQLGLLLSGVNCQTGATSGITAITHGTWDVTVGTGRFSGSAGTGDYTTYINMPGATAWSILIGTLSVSHAH